MAVRGSMENLPTDILLDIVSRVPAEYVFECKLVCKRWVTLIRQGSFTRMHFNRQLNYFCGGDDDDDSTVTISAKVGSSLILACRIEDPVDCKALLFHGQQPSDRTSIDEKYIYHENLKRIHHPPMHDDPTCEHLVGSCNGLVCAFQLHNTILDPIYICNPLTREYTYLPKLVVKKEDVSPDRVCRMVEGDVNMFYDVACGFGYTRSTNEYKVVRIHYLAYMEGNVEVYTLGSGHGWRAIGKVSGRMRKGTGTYANDAIYWISSNKVVAFDLGKEEFRYLSGPPCLQNRDIKDRFGLVALGRHLCLYMYASHMNIWSLTESSDLKETWSMEFDIDYEAVVGGSRKRKFQPVLLTKNAEIVFLWDKSVLYCYDTKTTLLKVISNKATSDNFEDVEAIAHVNTFASLGAMGENSKRYTVSTPRGEVIDELDRVSLGEEIDRTHFRLGRSAQ